MNPFHGAFPLWRNEQFVAATTELIKSHGPTRGDGGKRLATFAEMEQAVLLEAQRRELRFLNQRDAEERRLNDVEEEEPTCTAVVSMPPVAPLLSPADKSSPEAERVVSPENLHKLAAGLGEDDGEELDIEGDAALEEGLREEKENDASPEAETEKEAAAFDVVGGEKKKRFPSVLSDPVALRDPFLVAAADAAAGGAGVPARKSLQLGRRWYDGNQYPGGKEKAERGINPAGGAGRAGATSGDSGGSGAGGSGSGSGSGEAEPARPLAAFTRPPRLILYPDGSMSEAPLPGAVASGPRLAPTASLDANAGAPPPGFQPSTRGSATPFAYHPFAYLPPPWAYAPMPGQMFEAPMPPNPMGFAPTGAGFAPTVPPGFPPQPAAAFGFPPTYFAPGVPFPPAAAPFPFPTHPANAATFDARAVPSGSDGPGGAGSDGSGGSGGSGGTKVSSGPGYRSDRAAAAFLPKRVQTRMTKTASVAAKKGVATKKRPNADTRADGKNVGEKKAQKRAEKNIDDAADCLQMLSSGGTNV